MKVTWLLALASLGLAFLCWTVELWADSTVPFHFGHRPNR